MSGDIVEIFLKQQQNNSMKRAQPPVKLEGIDKNTMMHTQGSSSIILNSSSYIFYFENYMKYLYSCNHVCAPIDCDDVSMKSHKCVKKKDMSK